MSTAVTTKARLERLVRPFKFVANGDRKFEPNAAMLPCIASIACDGWQESSPGDKMHKLILVLAGQVDVEGASGGWLVIPNHILHIRNRNVLVHQRRCSENGLCRPQINDGMRLYTQ